MTTLTGSNRVIRGGSWNNNAQNLRSAKRNNDRPDNRNNNLGVRLVSTKQRFDQKVQSTDRTCEPSRKNCSSLTFQGPVSI